jgi:hypothetical protein
MEPILGKRTLDARAGPIRANRILVDQRLVEVVLRQVREQFLVEGVPKTTLEEDEGKGLMDERRRLDRSHEMLADPFFECCGLGARREARRRRRPRVGRNPVRSGGARRHVHASTGRSVG